MSAGEKKVVFLIQDDIDRHSQGCECGKCDSQGKSMGVSVRDVIDPEDSLYRAHACNEEAAWAEARQFCRGEGWQFVEFTNDIHSMVAGEIEVSLGDIIGLNLEEYLDFISEELVGSDCLGEVDYKLVGVKDGNLVLRVSGDISFMTERSHS